MSDDIVSLEHREVQVAELEAEIERLETALREIAGDPTGISIYQAEIARAALERKP